MKFNTKKLSLFTTVLISGLVKAAPTNTDTTSSLSSKYDCSLVECPVCQPRCVYCDEELKYCCPKQCGSSSTPNTSTTLTSVTTTSTTTSRKTITTTSPTQAEPTTSVNICKNVNCIRKVDTCDDLHEYCCGIMNCNNKKEKAEIECTHVRCPPNLPCDNLSKRCCGEHLCQQFSPFYKTTASVSSVSTSSSIQPTPTKSSKILPCYYVRKCYVGMKCETEEEIHCCGANCDPESYNRIKTDYTTTTNTLITYLTPAYQTSTTTKDSSETTVDAAATIASEEVTSATVSTTSSEIEATLTGNMCQNVNCVRKIETCDELQEFCCGLQFCENKKQDEEDSCKNIECPPQTPCDSYKQKCCGYYQCHPNSFINTDLNNGVKMIPTTSTTQKTIVTLTTSSDMEPTITTLDPPSETTEPTSTVTRAVKKLPCDSVPKCYSGMKCWTKEQLACCESDCDRESYSRIMSISVTTTSKTITTILQTPYETDVGETPDLTTTSEITPTTTPPNICANVDCVNSEYSCDDVQVYCCGLRHCKNKKTEFTSECSNVQCPPQSTCDSLQEKCCGYYPCHPEIRTTTRYPLYFTRSD